MKTRYLIAAALVLPILAGCVKEKNTDAVSPVRLRACIDGEETRVGLDGQGKFTWNTGDKVAIHAGSAFITDVEIANPATGDLTVALGEGVERNFYAVYPSAVSVENTTLQVALPTGYDITDILAGGDASDAFRRTSDYAPVPMVAENDPDHDILYFRHVGGLLRINCGQLPGGIKTAKVTFDKDVTGVYTVDTANPREPKITTGGTAANNVVTFTLSSAGLAEGTAFVLNVPVPCGTYTSVKMEVFGDEAAPKQSRTYSGSSLVFARRHGKALFFGDAAFDFMLGEIEDVTTEYTGGAKELSKNFVSYKTDGTVKEAVPFVLEYSATGTGGWTGAAPAWLSTAASVDFNGSTTGEELGIRITPQENDVADTHGDYLKSLGTHTGEAIDLSRKNVATGATLAANKRTTANCYVVQQAGAYKFPAVYGNALSGGETNEGAFRGKNGADAADYRSEDSQLNYGSGTSGTRHAYFARFKDHLNEDISYPFIADQLSHKNPALSISRAELLWTDVSGLVTDVALEGSGSGTYITFNVPVESICQGNAMIALFDNLDRIAWSWHIWVTDEDLTATCTSPTGYDFAPVNIGWCDTRDMQRYDERTVYVRARQPESGRTSTPKLVKANAGMLRSVCGHSPYYQWGRKDPLEPGYLAREGRVTISTIVRSKEYIAPNPAFDPHPAGLDDEAFENMNVGVSIQNPHIRYYFAGANSHKANWHRVFVYNLWNSSLPGVPLSSSTPAADKVGIGPAYYGVPVTKTVYDPSPVGYKVPPQQAFQGFTVSNFPTETVNRNDGRLYDGTLFFPYNGYCEKGGTFLYSISIYQTTSLENTCGDYREADDFGFKSSAIYRSIHVTPHNSCPVRPVKD